MLLGDFPEQRFRLYFQRPEFVREGGIEHGVRFLLVGHDVLLLPGEHALPALDGLQGRVIAVLVIPHHAAQQPVVRRVDEVVVVDGDGGQRGDEYLEQGLGGQQTGQLRVQPVDAFHDDDIVLSYAELLPVVKALSRLEGELGDFHFLACQQPLDVVGERVYVERVDAFVVIFAVLVAGRVLPVDKIIVQGQVDRTDAVYHQLDGKPFAERGFPGGGGTCNEHHLHLPLPCFDLVGNLGYFLLVQGFADFNHGTCHFLFYQLVQAADVGHFEDFAPMLVLVEHLEELVLRKGGQQRGRVFPVGQLQQHAVLVGDKPERFEAAGTGCQVAVKIVRQAVYII